MKQKPVTVTVYRDSWQTVHDMRARRHQIRHEAVIEFDGGIKVKTTRLSNEIAEKLLAAGAELVDRTKGTLSIRERSANTKHRPSR